MKKLIFVFTLLVAMLSGAYAAQKFTVPKNAQNIKRHFDKNGNEHVSCSLAGKKVAVAITRIVLRIPSADLVSEDSVSEDRLH